MENNLKLGLALGGGGARGLAHIGIIKGIEAAGIPVSYVGGSSMGGLLAAAYAAGLSGADIEKYAVWISSLRNMARLLDLKPPRRGLLESGRVRNLICEMLGKDSTFENLRLPLALTAVDLNTGEKLVLQEGSLVDAALATMSVPGLFPPVNIQGRRLIDGGVLDNLPVDEVRHLGADIVIAVDVSPDFLLGEAGSSADQMDWPAFVPAFARDFYQAELIMVDRLTRQQLRENPPDLLLHPALPTGISIFWGFNHSAEAILAGEACLRAALPEIYCLLAGEN